MSSVGRRSSNRPRGNPPDAAPPVAFFRKHKFPLAAALALVLAAIAYTLIPRGSREGTAGASGGSAGTAVQRFIGGADDGYVNAGSCMVCHQAIAASFTKTGMGRSFYRPRPEYMVEDFAKANTFYHVPSDEHYTMIRRGDEYFQRRALGRNGGAIIAV